MLSSAFAYLNRTILHCFASSRRRLHSLGTKKGKNGGQRVEQGTGRQGETEAGKGDEEEKKKICIMQSWEQAAFVPTSLYFL